MIISIHLTFYWILFNYYVKFLLNKRIKSKYKNDFFFPQSFNKKKGLNVRVITQINVIVLVIRVVIKEILKQSNIQRGIFRIMVSVFQIPLPFYVSNNYPFLNLMITTNHEKGLELQPIVKPLILALVQNLLLSFNLFLVFIPPQSLQHGE